MACVTGLLPVEQGVAAWAALRRDAEAIKAAGDDRGLGQLMADLFVERLTGQRCADEVPVEVQLVMDPEALLGTGDIRPPCPDTAPFPPPSRVSWSSARARRPAAPAIPAATATPAATVRRTGRGRARGCAGSSPTRRGAWSPSIPTDGTSRPPCVDSCAPGTGSAASPYAMRRRSATTITSSPWPSAAGPAPATARACAPGTTQTKARPGWRARAVGEGQAPDIETVTPTGHRHRSPAPPVQEVFTADPEPVEYLDTG